MLGPLLMFQELRRCDVPDAVLQLSAPTYKAGAAPRRLPKNLSFPARSTGYRPRRYQRRCAPSREGSHLQPAKTQNFAALIVQSKSTPCDRLQQSHPRNGLEIRQNRGKRLTRAYHGVLRLMKSPLQWSPGKKQSLQYASQTRPQGREKRHRRLSPLRSETRRFPSAKFGAHASRVV